MKRLVICLAVVTLAFASVVNLAYAQSVPEFKLGFKALADQIPDVVGEPLENEHFNLSNGNAEQRTSKGMMVWRKADNWTAFTNGYMTWINGPEGVQSRLNVERFSWEKDPPAPVPALVSEPVPTPQPAPVTQPTPAPAPAPQPTAVPTQAPPAPTPAPIAPAMTKGKMESAVLKRTDMAAGYIGGYRWTSENVLSAAFAPEGNALNGSIIYADLRLFSSDAEAQAYFVKSDTEYRGLDVLPAPLTGVHASHMYSGMWRYRGGETAEIRLVQFRVSNVIVEVALVGKTGVVQTEQAMRLAQTVASRLVAP